MKRMSSNNFKIIFLPKHYIEVSLKEIFSIGTHLRRRKYDKQSLLVSRFVDFLAIFKDLNGFECTIYFYDIT